MADMIINNKRALVGIAFSIVGLFILTIIMEPKLQLAWQEEQLASAITSMKSELYKKGKSKLDVDVVAQSAIVYDINSGETLFEKNADIRLPLASITKLFTALVAEENIGGSTSITITKEDLKTEGDSGLIVGDIWRERDLSDFMLAMSSNDAATSLANKLGKDVFMSKMNHLAKVLGLSSTRLFNESGLDISETRAGAYSSARDIANLLTYINFIKPELLEATRFAKFSSLSLTNKEYKTINTNKIVYKIPGLIGGKTGFTDLSGGNLAVIFDAGIGRPIVVVVLGSTKEDRFDDVLKLVNSVLK